MLKPHALADLIPFEDDLAEIVSELRKMRQKMQENELATVKLETDKAAGFIYYLKTEWVLACKSRVEKAAVIAHAERTHAKKTAERAGKK